MQEWNLWKKWQNRLDKNSSGKNFTSPIHGFRPAGYHEKTFLMFFSRKPSWKRVSIRDDTNKYRFIPSYS